jgi:uncharacterized damage-inducible protein DinB
MSDSLVDRYRRWFDYERDSHAKTLASLNAVAENLRESEGFRKAVYLMGHIVAARRMWLFRLGFLREDTDLFTRKIGLADLPAQIAAMEMLWSQYLDQLNAADVLRAFEYQSYECDRFQNTIEDILTQLFGHSWYHRGQIALLLRSIGAEPAVTDIVFWTRTPVEAPQIR